MSTHFFFPGGQTPQPFFRGTGPDFPDQDLVSMDDEQVKAIMLNLGITALIGPPANSFQAVTEGGHPTHWLMFVRWSGQKNAADNGYMMMGWRQSEHSFEEAKKYMAAFVMQAAELTTIEFSPTGRAPQS